jgi:hypothetical protein
MKLLLSKTKEKKVETKELKTEVKKEAKKFDLAELTRKAIENARAQMASKSDAAATLEPLAPKVESLSQKIETPVANNIV